MVYVCNVNVDAPEMLQQAYNDALIEAKMHSLLKTAFVPFENCSFKAGASEFYIPEYRHFEGRYTLTLKIYLKTETFQQGCYGPRAIDGEKFVSANISEEYTYILGNQWFIASA